MRNVTGFLKEIIIGKLELLAKYTSTKFKVQ